MAFADTPIEMLRIALIDFTESLRKARGLARIINGLGLSALILTHFGTIESRSNGWQSEPAKSMRCRIITEVIRFSFLDENKIWQENFGVRTKMAIQRAKKLTRKIF